MSSPYAERKQVLCIRVSNNGEYGSFYVEHYDKDDVNGQYLSLTANTTFGTVGYTWNNIGNIPWQKFVEKVRKDYLLSKLYGDAFEVFDPEATLAAIEEWAQTEDYSDNWDSADVLDACETLRDDGVPDTLYDFKQQLDSLIGSGEPYFVEELAKEKIDSQAEGLWRDLWPVFVEAAKNDLQERLTERELSDTGAARPRMRG